MHRGCRLLIAAWAALSAGCSGPATSPAETVRFTTRDGFKIGGTLYQPDADRPPALLLAHRYGEDRHTWDGFAERMRRAGYMVLAFDLRGHGASGEQEGDRRFYRRFGTAEWFEALNDFQAGRDLLFQRGADPDNLGVVGEALGANLAVHYALRDPAVQALVLVSPGLEYQGVQTEEAIRRLRTCPVLLLAAERDAYGAASAETLKAAAPRFSELHHYRGTAHGADLFAANPDAIEQVVQWLSAIIGPGRRPRQS